MYNNFVVCFFAANTAPSNKHQIHDISVFVLFQITHTCMITCKTLFIPNVVIIQRLICDCDNLDYVSISVSYSTNICNLWDKVYIIYIIYCITCGI